MSKLVNKFVVAAASSLLAFTAAAPAGATTWVITDVLNVSSGGFGASSFHDARGNVMSGSITADLPQAAATRTYDDITGVLSLTATVTESGNTFSISAA